MVDVPEKVMALAQAAAQLVRQAVAADARVVLFGSWAKGTAVPRSDIDLAVSTGATIRPALLARAEVEFERLSTLRRIDLVDLEAAGEELRAEILAHAIEL